jgi:hypothetical protein
LDDQSYLMVSIPLFRVCISRENVLAQLLFKLLMFHILRMSGNLDKEKMDARIDRGFRMLYSEYSLEAYDLYYSHSESIVFALIFC